MQIFLWTILHQCADKGTPSQSSIRTTKTKTLTKSARVSTAIKTPGTNVKKDTPINEENTNKPIPIEKPKKKYSIAPNACITFPLEVPNVVVRKSHCGLFSIILPPGTYLQYNFNQCCRILDVLILSLPEKYQLSYRTPNEDVHTLDYAGFIDGIQPITDGSVISLEATTGNTHLITLNGVQAEESEKPEDLSKYREEAMRSQQQQMHVIILMMTVILFSVTCLVRLYMLLCLKNKKVMLNENNCRIVISDGHNMKYVCEQGYC